MTAPAEIRAEVSTLRKVEPRDGPTPFEPRAAGKKSQALADEAAVEIRRLKGEEAELLTRLHALRAERLKLAGICDAVGNTNGEDGAE